ncbi:ribonuclease HII [Periweissella fabalis]|uniref:Ribonuclease HII n=1 Tax=Periweissella fabalis TaxID=1070421 RepID=A0A7X6MZZ1_9LACO|nr:ribonuclease HII [Periweissella fabalis]MCM0598998.1 ribonuclease HII [Periweissella fabalis]NKZ23278.1 ribonuclease HII [Periweissella fabalis]
MPKQTIKEIKAQLATITSPDSPLLAILADDQRQGVQTALTQWQRKYAKLMTAKIAFQEHLSFERTLRKQGYQMIAGVDEVGRGPLAGPVVAAAVILPANFELLGVNDSKQLSDKKRRELAPQIINQASAVGFGIVDAQQIDQINIYEASRVAMKQAIEQLQPTPDYLLVDAMVVDVNIQQDKLIKGDAKSASIGAASIIAKVKRDEIMADYDIKYPGYDFASNAGYGTVAHLAGLAAHGVSPIHRKTFAPVKKYL